MTKDLRKHQDDDANFQTQVGADLNRLANSIETIQHNHLAHIQVSTTETAKAVAEMRTQLQTLTETKTDVEWLKKFFWTFVTPAIGVIVVALLGLIIIKM